MILGKPRIEIDFAKISHNAKALLKHYALKGIDIFGVTKVICGHSNIANILVNSGMNILADSRIENIIRMKKDGIKSQFLLLRSPSLSQAEAVVKYTDISLNTELSVIKKLSTFAIANNTTHRIILMLELGDLREGILPYDLEDIVAEIIDLKGIELIGLGANMACFGGVKPDTVNMNSLSKSTKQIEEKFGIKLKYISGGSSANYEWFNTTEDIGRINNLRLGESIFLGCETSNRKPIPGLFTDAFTLFAELIELKIKPSLPYGTLEQDAYGNKPIFKDKGFMNRAILNMGLQDVLVSGISPRLDVEILGASSDHIIINTKKVKLNVGDEISFDMNYGALLSAMTSPYINKKEQNL